MEQFTTEELSTIVWMCKNEAARIAKRTKETCLLKYNDVYQRILSISKKAYDELTDRIYAE